MMLHDLLRSRQLRAAVSSVLSEQAPDSHNLIDLLEDLRICTSLSDPGDVAGALSLYLLAKGDHVGARLAYALALPEAEAHRKIEIAHVAPSPSDCFQFEPMTDSGQRDFALEPLLANWSGAEQNRAEQQRQPPRVARIDRGRVFGLSFIPVTGEDCTCLNWYTHNAKNPNNISMTEGASTIPLICPNAIMASFEGVDDYDEGVLIGNHGNFGHWLLNHLARLALASCVSSLEDVPLIVGENITPTQLECLERMGYRSSKLIRLRKGHLARFNTLWAPIMPFCVISSTLRWSPRIVDFLRARLGARQSRSLGRGRRFYLTRRDARWRRVVNEEEIIGNLAKRGFEVINPGNLTIAQQIDAAAEAEVIVGPFGAGMNLLLLAPRETTVVEFKHPRFTMDINPALCHQIGQRYFSVVAMPASSSPDPLKLDLLVSQRDIEQTLEAAGIVV